MSSVPKEEWLIFITMFLRKHLGFQSLQPAGRMLSKRQHQAGLDLAGETIWKHHLALQLPNEWWESAVIWVEGFLWLHIRFRGVNNICGRTHVWTVQTWENFPTSQSNCRPKFFHKTFLMCRWSGRSQSPLLRIYLSLFSEECVLHIWEMFLLSCVFRTQTMWTSTTSWQRRFQKQN